MSPRPWFWWCKGARARLRAGRGAGGKSRPRRPWREPLGVERLESRTLLNGSPLIATEPAFHIVGDPSQTPRPQVAQKSGFLAGPLQADLYHVHLDAGEQLTATVSAQSAGSGLESLLRVFDASGNQVALDDQEGGDPRLTFQAPGSLPPGGADYYVGISSAADPGYDPHVPGSGRLRLPRGAGPDPFQGRYTLDLRLDPLAPGAQPQPDLAASSFRLGTEAATYGESVPVTLAVENRGGAASGPFTVQVVISADSKLDHPLPLPGPPALAGPQMLGPGQALTPATFTVTLPTPAAARAAGLPGSGPVYLGLEVVLAGSAAQAFGPPQIFPAGGAPRSVAVADVNGDGIPDLVVANQFDNGFNLPSTVSILLGNGDGSFQQQQKSPVGVDPYSVAVADVNGNGKPDIIVANRDDNTVGVLLGQGDGTFGPQQTFPVGEGPSSVAVADVNGDGKPDLVVANTGDSMVFTNTVGVLLGNGDGTFGPQQTFQFYGSPSSVAVADVNGDGKPDLVVPYRDTVSVLLGNGDGTFGAKNTFSVYSGAYSVAVADLNGDGKPDLVVATESFDPTARDWTGSVSVLVGHGDGTFGAPQAFLAGGYPFPTSVAVADLNGDGKPDLVVATEGVDPTARDVTGSVSVLVGHGDGTFGAPQAFAVGGFETGSVAVADLNGDGRPDLVVGNSRTIGVSVLLGKVELDPFSLHRGSSWEQLQILADGPAPSTGNRTSNNGPLLTATERSSAQPLNDLNTLVRGTAQTGGADLYRLQVADTGRLDVRLEADSVSALEPRLNLYGGDGQLLISSAAGSGEVATTLTQYLPSGTYYLAVGGQVDGGSYQLTSEFVLASPPWEPIQTRSPQDFGLYTTPPPVAVADLNGDGNPDLIAANFRDNTVGVLLGNGDGTFAAEQSFAVGWRPTSVAVADVNGDGKPDLVVANRNVATVSVLLGHGDGTFTSQQTFAVGGFPTSVAVADLNGDGIPDLVVANNYDSTVGVLLGRGDGTFGPQEAFGGGYGPSSVAVADLNGDGIPDLAVANRGTYGRGGSPFRGRSVSVLLGQGDGTFGFPQTFPVGYGPSSVAVADVNGDGKPDLVVANFRDNTVSVLLGSGDGSFAPQQTFQVGSGPYSVTLADINGDGKPDLVAVNSTDNTASVLLGKGDGTFGPQLREQHLAGVGGQLLGILALYPGAVAVADVNGDGKPDLVVANGDDGTLRVMRGDGDGTFGPPQDFEVGSNPSSVAVADLNGDGIPDLAVANRGTHNFATDQYTGDSVSVLLGQGDGTFGPQQTFPVGNGPDSVAVADLNGDGIPDLVVTNSQGFYDANTRMLDDVLPGTVSVLLGKGDGTFGPQQTFNVGSPGTLPVSEVVADVNGDGIPDLVVGDQGFYDANTRMLVDSKVAVLLGKGDGTFGPKQVFPGPNPFNLLSLAVADVNGDGKPDIIVATYGDNRAGVLLGNGKGTFGPLQQFAISYPPTPVVDLNGDGKPDMVINNVVQSFDRNSSNGISVLLGHGDGTFSPSTPLTGLGLRATPLLADLDSDHIPDSVVLDHKGRILFRRGLGPAGSFDSYVVLNDQKAIGEDRPARDLAVVRIGSGWAVAAADAQPDPGFSMKAGRPVYTVSLYTYDSGTGKFNRTTAFVTDLLPERIAAANLNGDAAGLGDLVVASGLNDSITVAFQQPTGQFTAPASLTLLPDDTFPALPVGVAPSDIAFVQRPDGHGSKRFDIAVADQASGDAAVLLNDATDPFATQYRFRTSTGPYDVGPASTEPILDSLSQPVALATGTFTGPGHTDLLVVDRGEHSLAILPGDGHGGFGDPQFTLTTSTSDGLAINDQPGPVVGGDFNGDGYTDIAVLMEDRAEVWIYTNQHADSSSGRPVFKHTQSIPVGDLPTGLALAPGTDTGPSGGPYDLMVGNQFGDVLTLVGQADGSFKPLILGKNVPFITADLTGHGQQDVILANQSADQVLAQIRKVGTTSFTAERISHPTDGLQSPGGIALGDLNGDGLPDLVVADSGSNDVKVYLGTSPGHFSTTPETFFVGDSPVGVTIADLNGDGIPDLAVANHGSNDVSILLGQGQGTNWTLTTGPRLDAGAGPISVAVRDITGTVLVPPTGSGPAQYKPDYKPDGIPDLLVTSGQDGTVTLLPGIGSVRGSTGSTTGGPPVSAGSQGTGFFRQLDTPPLRFPSPLVKTLIPQAGGGPALALTQNGSIYQFNPDNLGQAPVQVFAPTGNRLATALTETTIGGVTAVVAARSDNTLSLLAPNAEGQLTEDLIFRDPRLQDPSALAVVDVGGQEEIYVTNAGQSEVVVIPFPEGVPPGEEASIPPIESEPGTPELGNPEATEVGPTGPLFAFNPAVDTTPPVFNTGQLEGGSQRVQSSDLQPVDNTDLALAATLRTGTAADRIQGEEASTLAGSFVVGLDSSTLGRSVTALLVGLPEGGPDEDTKAEGGTVLGDGKDGEEADRPPLADFLEGVDDAIQERKQDVEPGQPESDAHTPDLETLYAALDAFFGGQERPGPFDLSLPEAGTEASLVQVLARGPLGLAAPAPLNHSLPEVLDEVAVALPTRLAPTTEVQTGHPASAHFGEAGPPVWLATGTSAVETGDQTPSNVPPGAGAADGPDLDGSVLVPASSTPVAGRILWGPALVVVGWGHACLREQASPPRVRAGRQNP